MHNGNAHTIHQGQQWDVLVVGAGPAGSAAALAMAREGAKVLIADKAAFPRWKVCGCCINQNAQASLGQLGLNALPANNGAPRADIIALHANARSVEIPLPGYRILSRERFDATLARAAEAAGATFVSGANVTTLESDTDGRVMRLALPEGPVDITARIVIAADGLGGRVLRPSDAIVSTPNVYSRIGAGATCDDLPAWCGHGVIYMFCGHGGYVGIARQEEGKGAVGAAFDVGFVKDQGGLAEAAAAIIKQASGRDAAWARAMTWRGTPELTRRASHLSAHRAFVVGDAAGYVEPFTGQGMSWALASGIAVAPIALRHMDRFDARAHAEWEAAYHRVVTRRLWPCRMTSWLLRRPQMIAASLAVLNLAPAAAAPFVHHINKPV